jgi:hypothetical protein
MLYRPGKTDAVSPGIQFTKKGGDIFDEMGTGDYL